MKKKFVIIAIVVITIVSLSGMVFVNRGEIIRNIAEKKMPEYISDFCECDEIISELKTFSPSIVENWDAMGKKDKLYIVKSMQAIKLVRKNAILKGDPDLTYEEIEVMINKAKEISLKYIKS